MAKDATAVQKHHYKQIETSKTRRDTERRRMGKFAAAYRSRFYDTTNSDNLLSSVTEEESDGVEVEVNHLYAFIDTMLSNIVPTLPRVEIKARRAELEDAAKFRSMLVTDILRRDKAGFKLRNLATKTSLWARCFTKVVWDNKKKRPTIRVIDPQYVFFDSQASQWEDIRWICEVLVLTKGDIVSRTKKGGIYRSVDLDEVSFGAYPDWLVDEKDKDEDTGASIAREDHEWAVVYEFYDLVGKKFYHFLDGQPKPVYEGDLPYKHLPNPYHRLVFTENGRDLDGLADAELVFSHIERLNELLTLRMWHVKTTMPVPMVHMGVVDSDEDFADAYASITGPSDVLPVYAPTNYDIRNVVSYLQAVPLNFDFQAAIDAETQAIEYLLGLPSYARGSVGNSDVATELALTDTAQRTRNANRQKTIYDVMEFWAHATIALYQQFMDTEANIPMRMEGGDTKELQRGLLRLDEPHDPWSWDYDAWPFSATAENSQAALKQMMEVIPIMLGPAMMPYINLQKLAKKLAGYMNEPDLAKTQQEMEAEQQAAAQQAPMMPPGAEGAEGGPPGVPPEMAQMIQGGEVDGAESIAGGLEGGLGTGPMGVGPGALQGQLNAATGGMQNTLA